MSYDEFKLLLNDTTFKETHNFDAFPISSDGYDLYNIGVHTTIFHDGGKLFVSEIGEWIDISNAKIREDKGRISAATYDWIFVFYKSRKYDPSKDGKAKGAFSSLGDTHSFTVDVSVITGGLPSSPYPAHISSPRITGILNHVDTITTTSTTLNLRIDSYGRIIFG